MVQILNVQEDQLTKFFEGCVLIIFEEYSMKSLTINHANNLVSSIMLC
jgi:hypothetical protein